MFSGNGHFKPAAAARFCMSSIVVCEQPQLLAIWRELSFDSQLIRKISLMFLIDTLLLAICLYAPLVCFCTT